MLPGSAAPATAPIGSTISLQGNMVREGSSYGADATRSCRFALRARRPGLASKRSRSRSDQTICKLVHGRDRGRDSGCQRDEPGHRRSRRQIISADCFVERFRPGWFRLFYQLRKRKRKTARSQSLCGAGVLLDRTGSASSH